MGLRGMRSLVLGLVLAGCAAETEEDLIPDSALSSMQSSAALTVAPPEPAAPGAFHLRLTWGYLAGNFRPPGWVDWSGGLKVDSGTATLERLVFFDRRDIVVPAESPAAVAWKSRTLPHFDGVVVKVAPGAASDVLHVKTAAFERDFAVADLAAGVERRFDVGPNGHQISVSAIPAVGCGGFAYGYEKASAEGWLGFAGLLTDETGAPMGVLRFRADGEVVKARLVGKDQQVLAEGSGTLKETAFTLSLDGLGTVTGFFQAGSPRGSFQASLRCR